MLVSFFIYVFVLWLITVLLFSELLVGIRYYGLLISLLMLYYVVYIWCVYQSSGSFFYIFDVVKFGSSYIYLGFDTLSLSFISLTVFLVPFCIFFGYRSSVGLSQYSILLVFMSILLVYIFLVMDIFMFYVLFECILIPLFILIGTLGSRSKKLHSSVLLYSYTVLGSFLMIVVIFFLYISTCSSFYFDLWTLELAISKEMFLFVLLFISFSIKIPLFPFHVWLPEAHVEASTEGSVILAGVLLKLGGYAMLRFILPIFSYAVVLCLPVIYTVCVVGMLYVCLITLRQTDLKRIIAYSSIGHMSLVVMALYTNNIYAMDGSLYVMLSHGLVSGALFFCVGYLYEKYKTRQVGYYSNLSETMPLFSAIFFLFILSNIAFPGLFSFIGELYMVLGILSVSVSVVVFSLPSLFFTTVYSVVLYSRAVFAYSGTAGVLVTVKSDISYIDLLFFAPFLLLMGVWGIYPPVLILKEF